ncbi:hypothetical protein BA723_08365 [Helicobacter sp. CLO-3]|uniref:hypothetical protein n=1 Tax=Helicobacter sp. CLO-3 TaxID=211 RepID=UPI000804E5DB|nr:hypothetical protein [Helicobacter sp. CLO-3]OBV28713.1 hypothetical protein BA723_08365 [Helicobacter sp. CLO-3]
MDKMNICLQNDLSQDMPRIISPAVFIADAHYKTNGAGGDVVRVDFDSGANVDSGAHNCISPSPARKSQNPKRHCEEQSDEAIQTAQATSADNGLLRYARNDRDNNDNTRNDDTRDDSAYNDNARNDSAKAKWLESIKCLKSCDVDSAFLRYESHESHENHEGHKNHKSADSSAKSFGKSDLLGLLAALIKNPPAQVFLMGDIAHLLIGHIPSSAKRNRALIAAINELATKCEVFYFEGNHDFGLDSALSPNVKIYPRCTQPALFALQDATPSQNNTSCQNDMPNQNATPRAHASQNPNPPEVDSVSDSARNLAPDFMPDSAPALALDSVGQNLFLLSHGDVFVGHGYECYIRAINSPLMLSALKLIDTLSFGLIYKLAESRVNANHIRLPRMGARAFGAFVKKRFARYLKCLPAPKNARANAQSTEPINTINIIEGHFHIGAIGAINRADSAPAIDSIEPKSHAESKSHAKSTSPAESKKRAESTKHPESTNPAKSPSNSATNVSDADKADNTDSTDNTNKGYFIALPSFYCDKKIFVL